MPHPPPNDIGRSNLIFSSSGASPGSNKPLPPARPRSKYSPFKLRICPPNPAPLTTRAPLPLSSSPPVRVPPSRIPLGSAYGDGEPIESFSPDVRQSGPIGAPNVKLTPQESTNQVLGGVVPFLSNPMSKRILTDAMTTRSDAFFRFTVAGRADLLHTPANIEH
jgi:hypothetical protein